MFFGKFVFIFLFIFFTIFNLPAKAFAAEQPTAIFHAFNQNYSEVEKFVCKLADQGYSHVQISPAQKSNPGNEWWKRYQPLDYSVIEGLGSENDLKKLTDKAHSCNVQVIADVVFNHMANLDGNDEFEDISKFSNLATSDFNTKSTTNFTVAVENRNGKKYVTRWGTPNRGGMEVQGRDALYFIRVPFNQCTDQ